MIKYGSSRHKNYSLRPEKCFVFFAKKKKNLIRLTPLKNKPVSFLPPPPPAGATVGSNATDHLRSRHGGPPAQLDHRNPPALPHHRRPRKRPAHQPSGAAPPSTCAAATEATTAATRRTSHFIRFGHQRREIFCHSGLCYCCCLPRLCCSWCCWGGVEPPIIDFDLLKRPRLCCLVVVVERYNAC